ncbi:MAG TPA: hypothetical protein VE977_17595 [Pyrinomonadaceae bacterium]|nr:hypothetical protein [Pyrinomonadaceae bacterium]
MKKDAHGIHAETFRPAKLQIDPFRIKGVGLPHLELIDRARWVVVAANEPRLLRVPVARLLLRPFLLRDDRDRKNDDRNEYLDELS